MIYKPYIQWSVKNFLAQILKNSIANGDDMSLLPYTFIPCRLRFVKYCCFFDKLQAVSSSLYVRGVACI